MTARRIDPIRCQVLAEFNSEVVKKEANPNFNGEVFRTHLTPSDYKVGGVKVIAKRYFPAPGIEPGPAG